MGGWREIFLILLGIGQLDIAQYYFVDWIGQVLLVVGTMLLACNKRTGWIVLTLGSMFMFAFGFLATSSATILFSVVFCHINMYGWLNYKKPD